MKKIFFVLLLLGIYSSSYSQTDYSFVYNNDSILRKGVSLHESKKYKEALVEFEKVKPIDPKFLNAQYEKALSLSALEKKEDLKILFEDLYQKNRMPEFPTLYTLYGSFLSDEKEYEKSEMIFKEGEKYLSNSSYFMYNFAILYVRKEEPQKSIDILERIITNNPNHASSHYLLGALAFDNGKITEGTLAFMSYLIIAPTGRYAEQAILKLNAKFGQNYLEKNKLVFSKSGDNFEEIETILRNQLPLNSAYKVKSEIDDVVIRQVQALAEYTLEHKMGDGFFETTYIPWIKNLMEQQQFEGFSYYMLLSMENKLGKQLTSQKKKITDFNDNYILNEFWSYYAKRKLDHFGNTQEVIVSLKNGKPYLIGVQKEGKKEGKYKYLNEDGNLNGELNFKNDALEGLQKYYDEKGNLTEEKSFINNKLDGTRTAYFSNGSFSVKENYKDDHLEGISTSYYPNGGKQCEINFTNGERNGKFICLHENGIQKSSIDYTNGKINGAYLSYNEVGDLIESSTYVNGLIEGDYHEYYDGKVLKSESKFSNGKNQDSYKSFYSNATLERENTFENGKIKKSNNYFLNGKKSSEALYNENEELDTYSYFDMNGNLYFEEKYKGGELKSGLQYSSKNAKPTSINLTKSAFEMSNFEGKLLVSGRFEKGKKSNEWIHNFGSGTLRIKEFYRNGNQDGLSTDYYENGLVNSIKNYSNDTINGTYEVYENGVLDRTFSYAKGNQNGPFTTFYSDGSLKTEGYFIDGDLNFYKNIYWQNGTVARKEKFIDDHKTSLVTYNLKGAIENNFDYKNKTGKFTFHYNNGTIIQVADMINGKLNGKFISKDNLNTPILECEYVNGLLHNSYKKYSPLGTVFSESIYYCGKLNGSYKQNDLVGNLRLSDENTFGDENGKSTRYYPNKSKMTEYNELNGLVIGEQIYYNQKEEPILALGYDNNILSYYIRKSKTGLLDEKVAITDETAEIISLYPNGKTAIQMHFVKGNLEGQFSINNNEGKPEFECQYHTNLLDGDRIVYYTNGAIYKKEHFVKNNYEGPQEYFKEDKKPWLTATYKNDELHGNTFIYKEGKLVLTKKYDSDELVEIIK